MFKRLLGAALLVLFCVTVLVAAEIKGTVKSVKKGVITVTVDKKDQEVTFTKDTKFFDSEGKEMEKMGRNKALKDKDVIIKTEKEGDKEVAKEVRVKK